MAKKVLVREDGSKGARPVVPSVSAAWRWIGWFGLALALAGLGDFVLAWFPTYFGRPEWEFATVAATFAGLPLVTMGLAGLMGAAMAIGSRGLIRSIAWGLLVWSALLIAAYALFLTSAPIALDAVTGVAAVGIKKAIAKTTLLFVVFVAVYVIGSVGALRHIRTGGKREGT